MEKICHTWKLDRYARNTETEDDESKGTGDDWEYFDNGMKTLELTLVENTHLFIHHGKTLMESLSLTASKTWMRGISKGDSLLVLYRLKGDTRRFRIKFSDTPDKSSSAHARICFEILSKLFPIKMSVEENKSGVVADIPCLTLEGNASLGDIGKVLSSNVGAKLPLAYHQHTSLPTEHIGTFLKLCLSDVNFPAFVEAVDKELSILKQES